MSGLFNPNGDFAYVIEQTVKYWLSKKTAVVDINVNIYILLRISIYYLITIGCKNNFMFKKMYIC